MFKTEYLPGLYTSKVGLKQKATGMGTPVAIKAELSQNYDAEWRRAHTDCSKTTTDAKFIIKHEPPSF